MSKPFLREVYVSQWTVNYCWCDVGFYQWNQFTERIECLKCILFADMMVGDSSQKVLVAEPVAAN